MLSHHVALLIYLLLSITVSEFTWVMSFIPRTIDGLRSASLPENALNGTLTDFTRKSVFRKVKGLPNGKGRPLKTTQQTTLTKKGLH